MLSSPLIAAGEGPLVIDVPAHYGGPLIVENRTFDATGPGQTALTMRWPTAPSISETTVILRNITIRTGFANGIHLINAWNARLDTINIYGAYDGDMQNGIILSGQSHDVRVDAATVMHAITGVYVPDVSEGTVIRGSTFLGVTYGVFAASSSPGRPWLVIGDSHIAASRAGIVAVNRKQVSIHHSLIYRHLRGYVEGDPWEGIHLDQCAGVAICDVQIDGRPNDAAVYPGRNVAVTGSAATMTIQAHGCDE